MGALVGATSHRTAEVQQSEEEGSRRPTGRLRYSRAKRKARAHRRLSDNTGKSETLKLRTKCPGRLAYNASHLTNASNTLKPPHEMAFGKANIHRRPTGNTRKCEQHNVGALACAIA